jgi:tetratricopeptide (TPR) repeat protein
MRSHDSRIYPAGHSKAVEAQSKAEQLQKLMDLHEWHDNAIADLQVGVKVCVANCAHAAALDQEALDIYRQLVGNSDFQMPSRMRVNIGNMYAAQGQWFDAIKQYRMALDQIPTDRQASASAHESVVPQTDKLVCCIWPQTPRSNTGSQHVSQLHSKSTCMHP